MSVYNQFYGFRENPFNQTPDTSFFFPSDKHRTALDALVFAISQRKGFVVITGEIGCGKTTVARTLLRRLDGQIKSALITNTHLSPKGVITLILEDLGVEYKQGSKERLILQLNNYLIQQIREDQNVVFIIDEAQNLSPACLEEIRMLSNLETEKEKLLQIVLIGQPELRSKLELPRLEQLRQRVRVNYHLHPLGEDETKKYIRHRIQRASKNAEEPASIFMEEALDMIYQYSKGVPRLINMICEHSLLSAFVMETKVITQTIVQDVISEFNFGRKSKHEQIYQSA